jgi:hypothetical protein
MADQVESQTVVRTSHKTLLEHLAGVARHWLQFVLTAFAVFGALWTMADTGSYFLSANFADVRFYVVAVGFSLVVAGAWTIRAYLNDSPPGFELESPKARRIAHLQRSRWEFALARELLATSLDDLDDELEGLSAGRVFVPTERRLDFPEYIHWVSLAPDNLFRMIDVAQQLLVVDFAAALGHSDFDERPAAIRAVIRRIRRLYAETVSFERSMRAVTPPEGTERLHELQMGWSEPIRGGVRQLFDFVDAMNAVDKKEKDAKVEFTVVIDAPLNMAPFCAELARVQAQW